MHSKPMQRHEAPIVCRDGDVRAILAGRKTQVRQPIGRLRVRLPRTVSADFGFLLRDPLVAKPGVHDAGMNPLGAVSVRVNGRLLGVKPGEFDFVCPFVGDGVTRFEPPSGDEARWVTHPTGHGARLWVRETFAVPPGSTSRDEAVYRADVRQEDIAEERRARRHVALEMRTQWASSSSMPRWAARIFLDVVSVRVEHVQEIDAADIRAEGVACPDHDFESGFCVSECPSLRTAFAKAWDAKHGQRAPWASNPWVWSVEFKLASESSS